MTAAAPPKSKLAEARIRAANDPALIAQIELWEGLRDELVAEISDPTKKNADAVEALARRLEEQDGLVKAMADQIRRANLPYVGGYAGSRHPEKDFNFGRACRGFFGGQWEKGPEREMLAASAPYIAKGQFQSTDNLGGFAIPAEIMDQWVDVFWAREVLGALGVEVISGVEGLVKWVRVKNSSKPDLSPVNEGAASTEQTVNLEELEIGPKTIAAHTLLTLELVSKQGGAKFGTWIENALRKAAMLKLQKLALIGAGGAGEPLGFFNALSASQVNDWSGADFAGADQTVTDELLAMEGILEDADALDGRLGYLMSPKTRRKLVGVKDADGRLLFQPGQATPEGKVIRSFNGYPYQVTSQLASGETTEGRLGFGNWDDFKVLTWGPGVVFIQTQEGFTLASTRKRMLAVHLEMNDIVLREQSFSIADNLTL